MKRHMVAIASLVTVLAACSSQPRVPAANTSPPAAVATAAVATPAVSAAAAAASPSASTTSTAAAPAAATSAATAPAAATSASSPQPAAAKTAAAATASPPVNRTLISAGYKPTTIKGAVYYCRTIDVTNTAFKKKVCLSEAQIQDEEAKIKEMQREMLRRQPNGSCLGPTCAGD